MTPPMKQSAITNYFKTPCGKKKEVVSPLREYERCFIYDPMNKRAFFTHQSDPGDQYIGAYCKKEVALFLRPAITHDPVPPLPRIEGTCSAVLLKSNLQKAIRRQEWDAVITSTLVLLQIQPSELLRRLPIICIEDVTMMSHYPILVWWMMAAEEYTFTERDTHLLCDIVYQLCMCPVYYDDDHAISSSEVVLEENDSDEVQALYYRLKYGGMKGDMKMLTRAIHYYRTHDHEIKREWISMPSLPDQLYLPILSEAVDFHIYPSIVTILAKQSQQPRSMIKEWIWHVDSGWNARKPDTDRRSRDYFHHPLWASIRYPLRKVRAYFIKKEKEIHDGFEYIG